ncbi:MAG: hypothetical protein PHT69_09370 [Bacteroidales bacterium]|nr:hypothetical protein [Bacteroidales bacterium]
MSIFKKLFGSSTDSTPSGNDSESSRSFGRYTDINKSREQLDYWKKSNDDFATKNYVNSYYNLMQYLRDPQYDNVKVTKSDNAIEFEIIQGSQLIRGRADNNKFNAESKIAKFDRPSVAFMRQLVNSNFIHQYTRFAIKDNFIYLKCDSKSIDASPNKLYASLKELALKADKMDDFLINEFDLLQPIEGQPIIKINDNEKEIMYKYLIKWINDDLNRIAKLDEGQLSGGISFILLALLFRIDYLLKPQGNLFNKVDKINGIYNAKDNKTTIERTRLMIDEFKAILNTPKEKIIHDFYDTKNTFGYVGVTSHKQFYEFILEQFKNTQWYYDNRYNEIVTLIYEYIIGYSLYYFGLYPATFELLKIAYMVMQADFFKEIGINGSNPYFNSTTQTLNGKAIESAIQKTINKYKKDYPNLNIVLTNVKYRNMNEFLYTYLNEITYLNFAV